MDTLGTITPKQAAGTPAEHRTEALERLRYLAHAGMCGLITGDSGTGKSWCLRELASQLKREGIATAQISLTAVSAEELPRLVTAKLGSGLVSGTDPFECWMWLQEFAVGRRNSTRKLAFLIDDLQMAEDTVIAPLSRMVNAFSESCSWIFAVGESISPAWKAFLNEHIWLRVELHSLAERESLQLLSRDLLQRGSAARFTPQGIAAAQEIAQGRIRRLQQIAELATIACEAEGITQIDAEMVHSLAAELV